MLCGLMKRPMGFLILGSYVLLSDVLLLALFGNATNISGSSGDEPTILNGQKVTDHRDYGFMAYLTCSNSANSVQQSCGGSLIGIKSNYVLTSGHCVHINGVKVFACSAVLGTSDRTDVTTAYRETYFTAAEDITVHPNFAVTSVFNDIAILKLRDLEIPPSDYIYPIQLVGLVNKDSYKEQQVTRAGWGLTNKADTIGSKDLMSVQASVRDDSTCHWYMDCPSKGVAFYKNDSMICYGGFRTDADCPGDAGGPVYTGSGKTAIQISLISFGIEGPLSTSCPDRDTSSALPTSSTTTTTHATNKLGKSGAKAASFLNFIRRVVFDDQPAAREDHAFLPARAHAIPQQQSNLGQSLPELRQSSACDGYLPAAGPYLSFYKGWIDQIVNA